MCYYQDRVEQSLSCQPTGLYRRYNLLTWLSSPIQDWPWVMIPLQATLVTPSRCRGKSELCPSCAQVWLLLSSPAMMESCGLMVQGQRSFDTNLRRWLSMHVLPSAMLLNMVTPLPLQRCSSYPLVCVFHYGWQPQGHSGCGSCL